MYRRWRWRSSESSIIHGVVHPSICKHSYPFSKTAVMWNALFLGGFSCSGCSGKTSPSATCTSDSALYITVDTTAPHSFPKVIITNHHQRNNHHHSSCVSFLTPIHHCVQRRYAASAHSYAKSSASSSSSSSSSSAAGAAAQRQRQKEEEEDKRLEEEEFAELHRDSEEREDSEGAVANGGFSFSALALALGQRGEALDMERQRLRWALFRRRQLLASAHGSSLLGRPANVKAVLQRLQGNQANKADGMTTTSTSTTAAGAGFSMENPSSSPLVLSQLASSAYTNWRGSSSPFIRLCKAMGLGRDSTNRHATGKDDGTSGSERAVATLTEDIEYLRKHRSLHLLSYYHRMNFTPKRNIWHATFHTVWNAYLGVSNALWSLVSFPFRRPVLQPPARSSEPDGAASSVRYGHITPASFAGGVVKGCAVAVEYLLLGLVLSPLVQLTAGAVNGVYGVLNFFTGKYMYDAISGRWMRCSCLDTQALRLELQREKRLIRAIGRMEFKRKKMKSADKWKQRMSSMGFSMEDLQEKMTGGALGGNKKQNSSSSSTGGGGGGAPRSKKTFNPYDVLHVKRSAPLTTIKAQYKKLAMVFHPDVAQSATGGPLSEAERRQAQDKFEEISRAYQILSNSEKRRAYDMGGEDGLAMHASQYGQFLARTPEEVVQSLFGGEAFRCLLVGELLRSHWALRYEAQVSVSLQELEELQCIRVRQMAMELAIMADVHANQVGASPTAKTAAAAASPTTSSRVKAASTAAGPLGNRHSRDRDALWKASKKPAAATQSASPPNSATSSTTSAAPVLKPGSNPFCDFSPDFMARCDAFVNRLSDACFGRELMHEIGLAYVSGAQRFLGLSPFYAPKVLVTKKIFTGIDRIWNAFKDQKSPSEHDPNAKQEFARKVMIEYFNMEYDNVVADLHVCLRFAVQQVLQDCSVSETVRRRRCYAVWYLGQKMLEKGLLFGTARKDDDAEMLAYIQQAANSSASTAKPKPF